MMATPGDKNCILCGNDVSTIKRIKDRKGRYYCYTCYQEARARIEAKRRAAESDETAVDEPSISQASMHGTHADATHSDTLVASTAADEDLSDLLDSFEDSAASQTSAPASASASATGVTATGYLGGTDPDQAKAQENTLSAPAPHISPNMSLVDALQQSGWFVSFAVVSVVLGGLGLLLNGLAAGGVVGRGVSNGDIRYIIGGAAIGAVPLLMSWWLLRAGLGILKRRAAAITSISNWAIIKIALTGLGGIALIACVLFKVVDLNWFLHQSQMHRLTDVIGSPIAGIVIYFSWQVFWPVYVLVYLSRASIRRDTYAWV